METEKSYAIHLDRGQCINLLEFFEIDFISFLKDIDVDNMAYLESMIGVWRQLKDIEKEIKKEEK